MYTNVDRIRAVDVYFKLGKRDSRNLSRLDKTKA